MFHKHKWVEIERFYAEPIVGPWKVKHCAVPLDFHMLTMGVTTILYECRDCHKPRKEQILGKSMKEFTDGRESN